MAWLALCTDHDERDTATLRRTARDAHFAYIESIMDRLLIAGPLPDPTSGEHRASVFVYCVESEAEARRLLEEDPYHRAGIYGRITFYRFIPAAGQWLGGTLWGKSPPTAD